jgi:hypothetical protein
MSLEGLRRALADENVKNDLFRLLESESFDSAILHGLYPALHQQWTDIANAMQVPWQYIMVLDLSLAAAMAPTAVLFALPTLQIYPVRRVVVFAAPRSTQHVRSCPPLCRRLGFAGKGNEQEKR